MLKVTVIGLFIVLVLIIVYQFYQISEGFAPAPARIKVTLHPNSPFIDIKSRTTDGSTIRGVKILYSSTTPVLARGQSTDSTLALNLVIPPETEEPNILNKPFTSMKSGFKYYFVPSNVTRYVQGVTPLLGSFVYSGPTEPTQPQFPSVATRTSATPSAPSQPSASSSGQPIIVAWTDLQPPYVNILANTTDNSTQDTKILYNSNIPILQPGQSTNSILAGSETIGQAAAPIKKSIYNMRNGHKYYIVASNVDKYTEGVTPLLGSFVYSGPTSMDGSSQVPNTSTAPVAAPAIAPPTAPVAAPAQPTATLVTPQTAPTSNEAAIAKEKQDKASLLRDIQEIVRTELLQQQKLTTASSQPVLTASANTNTAPQVTPATAQGQELSTARDKFCPKDMSQYIRKDSIPCWNCTLDY